MMAIPALIVPVLRWSATNMAGDSGTRPFSFTEATIVYASDTFTVRETTGGSRGQARCFDLSRYPQSRAYGSRLSARSPARLTSRAGRSLDNSTSELDPL